MELLFAVAIISLVAAIFIRPFSLFQKRELLRKETDTVAALLEKARSSTLASINNKQYGVHFATSSASFFQGTAFTSEEIGNETHVFDPLVSLDSVLLQGGGRDVVFKKRTGETDFYGSIMFSVVGSISSSTIAVHRTGLIEAR